MSARPTFGLSPAWASFVDIVLDLDDRLKTLDAANNPGVAATDPGRATGDNPDE